MKFIHILVMHIKLVFEKCRKESSNYSPISSNYSPITGDFFMFFCTVGFLSQGYIRNFR